MDLNKLNKDNFDDVLNLFDSKFYFLTTYPNLVYEEELKNFLIESGQTYLVKDENKVVGIAYFKNYGSGYLFFKFKLNNFDNEKKSKSAFNKFLKILQNDENKLKRLESFLYEFERKDIEFLKKVGFYYESERKDDVLLDNTLRSMFVYSAVDNEINNIFTYNEIYD